ncbi:hypothetical protein Hanom_Chr05g00449171 [Helianthus anomalus]
MGFGSILKLITDSLLAKLSHFVVDKFNRKDMNSGNVIECKKKEKKKEEHREQKDEQKKEKNVTKEFMEVDVKEDEDEDEKHGIFAEWSHEGCALTPCRIVERLRDNPTEEGIMFKYDFLTLE